MKFKKRRPKSMKRDSEIWEHVQRNGNDKEKKSDIEDKEVLDSRPDSRLPKLHAGGQEQR